MKVIIKGKECFIDKGDLHFISEYTWHPILKHNTWYLSAFNKGHSGNVYLHRLIFNTLPGKHVDHINGNGLDNRKCNLRLCNQSQNQANCKLHSTNKSGHKGVSFCKQTGKWRATINVCGKQISLGRFEVIEEAALAYENAAIHYFKEFARFS